MSHIRVNDVFEELSEENKRLFNELLFANKCLKVLIEFKTFIDFISDKLKTNLDSNESQKFEELREKAEEVFNTKAAVFSHFNDENQLLVTKRLPLEPKKDSIMTSKKLKSISLKTSKSIENKYFRQRNSQKKMIYLSNNESIEQKYEYSDGTEDMNSVLSDNQFDIQSKEAIDRNVSSDEVNDKQIKNQNKGNSGKVSKQYRCDECDLILRTAQSLRQHRVHHNSDHFLCAINGCEFRAKDSRTLRRHKNSHSNNGVICEYPDCGKVFSSRDNMRGHYRKHFDEYSFTCDVEGCDYRTWRRSKLISHLNVHSGVRPHECSSCDKRFHSLYLRNQHFKREHIVSDEPNVCQICQKSFQNVFKLRIHEKVCKKEKRFACDYPECQFKGKTNNSLKLHLGSHSTQRPYACTFEGCNKTFKRKTDANSHMIYHLPDRNFKCTHEECNKTFKTKKDLSNHMIRHSEGKYSCDWPGCEYRTPYPYVIKTHRDSVHLSERNHLCVWPQCGKGFNTKVRLNEHQKIHNNDKRYVCHWPGCQYRCSDGSNLKKHFRVHQKN